MTPWGRVEGASLVLNAITPAYLLYVMAQGVPGPDLIHGERSVRVGAFRADTVVASAATARAENTFMLAPRIEDIIVRLLVDGFAKVRTLAKEVPQAEELPTSGGG